MSRMVFRGGQAAVLAAVASVSFGIASIAGAATLDFESQVNGKIVNNQYRNYAGGLTITADNFRSGGPDLAIIFDTRKTNTRDLDLQGPNWFTGNIAKGTVLGNALIIAENADDANHDGLIDHPDDEGSKPPGEITFHFKQPQQSLGFDLIDIDGPTEWDNTRGYFSFLSNGQEIGRVGLGDFIDPASPFFDRTVVYHDNSANRIQPISASDFGANSFDTVIANYGWCMAMDNVVFTPVPEPSAMIMLVGLGTIVCARRRRVMAQSLQ